MARNTKDKMFTHKSPREEEIWDASIISDERKGDFEESMFPMGLLRMQLILPPP